MYFKKMLNVQISVNNFILQVGVCVLIANLLVFECLKKSYIIITLTGTFPKDLLA